MCRTSNKKSRCVTRANRNLARYPSSAQSLRSRRHHEVFFFSSRRRHTRSKRVWSSDVCSSDLFLRAIDLEDAAVSHESKFPSENLVISPAAGGGPKYLFIFPRPHAALVEQIVRDLRQRLRDRKSVV